MQATAQQRKARATTAGRLLLAPTRPPTLFVVLTCPKCDQVHVAPWPANRHKPLSPATVRVSCGATMKVIPDRALQELHERLLDEAGATE